MVMRLKRYALSLLVLITSACASLPAAEGEAASTNDRTVLGRDEILRGEYQTAYDAILARRRTWLIARPDLLRGESTPTVVYIDDMKMGGLDELRGIPVARIAHIKYYDGTAAYARWGLGHDRGAIQVITVVPTPKPKP
jgi:hypothetical protein